MLTRNTNHLHMSNYALADVAPSLDSEVVKSESKLVLKSPVTALPFQQQMKLILRWAREQTSKVVCVANVHMLVEAYHNIEMNYVMQQADLVTPDGMPLVWMLKLLGAKQQDRVAGLDILQSLCCQAVDHQIQMFFLGSQNLILERMRNRLEQEFPSLKIAGMESLPFRALTPAEDDAIVETINKSGAGLVFVSLGCPKQEIWMSRHKGRIKAVMIGLGGAFPVYAGIQKRAPRWVRTVGLEWAYRLLQEPRRLWKRYLTTNPLFVWLALKQLILGSL